MSYLKLKINTIIYKSIKNYIKNLKKKIKINFKKKYNIII